MKVLQILPYYHPAHRYGGPVASVHGLSKALVELGVEVSVFTSNIDGPGNLDVPLGENVLYDGVNVCYFPVQQPRLYVYTPQLKAALAHGVTEFDLVHIHGLYLYPITVAARICRQRQVPYIVSPRGMLDPYAMNLRSSMKKRAYIELIERRNLTRAAMLHFTAEEERQLASWLGLSNETVVIPNGLDLAAFETRTNMFVAHPSRIADTVLFLSRIHPKKGLDLLIPAFARVLKEFPTAQLVLAGPDNDGYLAVVTALIARYGLQDKVTYAGMLLGQEKLAALRQAAVFVLPSYSENFGIVVVEALACEAPVVITDRVNIHREIEQANCGVVTSCEADSVAQGILQVLKDPVEARQMGQRGRKLVEDEFTWTAVAQSMLLAYEKAVDAYRH